MTDTGLQDGMLQYYNSIAAQSDANVEARIEREAFDVTTLMFSPLKAKDETEGMFVKRVESELQVYVGNETPSDNDLALPSYLAGMRRHTP